MMEYLYFVMGSLITGIVMYLWVAMVLRRPLRTMAEPEDSEHIECDSYRTRARIDPQEQVDRLYRCGRCEDTGHTALVPSDSCVDHFELKCLGCDTVYLIKNKASKGR